MDTGPIPLFLYFQHFICYLFDPNVFPYYSIKLLDWTVKPAVTKLLQTALSPNWSLAALRGFDALYAALWLLPAYVISFFVSCIWYGEIAERTALAAQRQAQQEIVDASGVVAPAPTKLLQVRRPDAITSISQEIYRSLLFCVFFILATVAARLPYVGFPLSFAMFSWLYALYSFDYKWNLHGVPLQHRTQMVEDHWAYFAGFGALMIFVGAVMPYFEAAAVVGWLFPLFIVASADANPRKAYSEVQQWYTQRNQGVKFARVPVFGLTVWMSNALLAGLSVLPGMLGLTHAPTTAKGKGRAPKRK